MSRRVLLTGALLAGIGVALGAFGAHALGGRLDQQQLGWWRTAVQYQMWHAVALVALGAAGARRVGAAAVLLALGTVLFSGSLYLMALTGLRWLGVVTPVGGAALIAGWAAIAWRAARDARFPRR